MTEPWEAEARRDLAPKVASSAYVVAIAPDDIDPKQALELGYAILLDKPLVVVAPVGQAIPPGLRRIASKVIRYIEDEARATVLDEIAEADVRRVGALQVCPHCGSESERIAALKWVIDLIEQRRQE